MIKIFEGKKGYKSASFDGVIYHSLYNPSIEAQRFIDANVCRGEDDRLFIILGSGLAYIDEEVSKRWPKSRIISIPNDQVWNKYRLYHQKNCYCYMYDKELVSFLDEHIYDYELGKIELLFWPLDRDRNEPLQQVVTFFLMKLQASCMTVSSFGYRWFKNSFKNYLKVKNIVKIGEIGAIFIASSGPSLIESLVLLKSMRDRFFLIALPSSISFLNYHGIRIDMVVTIDGGYYAKMHLLALHEDVIIATTLLAETQPKLIHYFFSFGTPVEKLLLPEAPLVKWAGTVAATAIDLALQLTSENIFLAGQDFYDNNLMIHAKPHTFDSLYMEMSNRLNPAVTIFQRLNFSSSMSQYAEWFRSQSWPSRLKRLSPSQTDLSIQNISIDDVVPDYNSTHNKIMTYFVRSPSNILISEIFMKWIRMIDKKDDITKNDKIMMAFYLDTFNYLKGNFSQLKTKVLKLQGYVNRLISNSDNS